MSKVIIEVSTEILDGAFGIERTTVRVDGQFMWRTVNSTAEEVENLRRLIDALDVENTEVVRR